MGTLLVQNARVLVTMDTQRREIESGSFFVRDGRIEQVRGTMPKEADQTVDASGCVVTPGLINTHHHLYQSLTRAIPACEDALLFGWLQTLYPIWARFTPDDFNLAARIGLAELALSGCTLSSDHQYMFPNGSTLQDSIEAARSVGLRLHATRGSMSIGQSAGGLPPDTLVEFEEDILNDCIDMVDRFHDASEGAMIQVALAPCSPFSVSRDLMSDTALLAREKGVMMHTHLAENDEDIAFSQEKFGCRPGQYAEDLGWTGDDVWHAHCVKLDKGEIDLFARTKTGVAHCPCSNCRLGSGIAPVKAMREAGVKVGLGVDGSASNDGGHLSAEMRQAMLLQRVANGADALSARCALELATRGGAQVLGRDDLGSIEVGKRADFVLWPTDTIAMAGAWDPVSALVLTGPTSPKEVWVEGRLIVADGQLTTEDVSALSEAAAKAVARLSDA